MKITQENLDAFTRTIKIVNNNISNLIGANSNNITNWFNEYWVSRRSKSNANTIDNIFSDYQSKIIDLFDDINNQIKRNAYIHNNNEKNEEKVYYRKRSLIKTKTNIQANMNFSLPNNYIGRKNNTADVYYPLKKVKETIEIIDKQLKTAINTCNVISNKGEYREYLQKTKNETLNTIDLEIDKLKSIYE